MTAVYLDMRYSVLGVQWDLCIMDTLGPAKVSRCPDFPGLLYDKVPFGTTTKCVDYAGVLIINCPH